MDVIRYISLALIASLPIHYAYAAPLPAQDDLRFSTTQGLGFDKQISIWLVEKYISPKAPIEFYSGDQPPPNTRVFDEANAEFSRTADHSTYEQLVGKFLPDNGSLTYFREIVFDIEINLWLPDKLSDSQYVEKAFRTLQEQWGRDSVPHTCYSEFFNAVEQLYVTEKTLKNAEQVNKKLTCWRDTLKKQITDPSIMVPSMPIPALLGHLRSGAKTLFVDVREPDEFAENHIPGAVNLLIKDADKSSVAAFKGYDIVVAYCIKDFRGFEMAKKLKSLGISQAVILNPYGIKGWIDSKLPVYQKSKVDDKQAVTLLDNCITQPLNCKTGQEK